MRIAGYTLSVAAILVGMGTTSAGFLVGGLAGVLVTMLTCDLG